MLITLLAVIVLAATAANLVHWRLRGHRLLYWPTGNLGMIWNALALGQLPVAVFMLLGLVSSFVFWITLFCYAIWGDVYSIHFRRRLGQTGSAELTRPL